MKSIILLVVLALCHTSLGKPGNWQSLLDKKPCACPLSGNSDASPVYSIDSGSDTEVSEGGSGFQLTQDSSEEGSSSEEDSSEENRNSKVKVLSHSSGHGHSSHSSGHVHSSHGSGHGHSSHGSGHGHSSHGSGHGHHSHNNEDCDFMKTKPRISYGPEQVVKGRPETFIHHQPKIVVRQPPTHVKIEHAPTIIEPSTIMFRRQGKTVRRPVIYQHLPQDVRVRPVYVKVVKPIEKKVIIEKKSQQAQVISSSNKDLEYETSHSGHIYNESFDERQEGSKGWKKSKHGHSKHGHSKHHHVPCKTSSASSSRSYSGSYDEQQEHSKDVQSSKQVHLSQYEGASGSSFSGSMDEHEHEEESYHGHVDVQETESY